MDDTSKVQNVSKWKSTMRLGTLHRLESGDYEISWGASYDIIGKINEGGRGMELSELVNFQGQLLTCDDRSGIVYVLDIHKHEVYPCHIFGGDTDKEKGFKCEWMTVKDDELYIGSMGKEWTRPTGPPNPDPLWVKKVSSTTSISVEDWSANYHKLNAALGINSSEEGYLVHEAVTWDSYSREWIFMPRRVSVGEPYDPDTEGTKGSNHVLRASEDFEQIRVTQVGNLIKSHGFSSIKLIPSRPDEVAALKTVELDGTIETCILLKRV
eukprot:TRINITY_DN13464_c0_g1_i10.p1 TRINITY_DN13464_c0_g1~~TRINITY_DN13464_c0_g1_i10.p1  ORF type:complete len:268 (-),score=22.88 TRINITY_DN13464_c0_g1_i10:20-823(-)